MSGKERCGEYNETLSAYLDGELTSAERTDLLQHLATCAGCRAALEEYRAIGSRIRGLPPILVPESLTASIYMNTVDAPPRRLQVLTSRMAYPAAAVAAVLMVFVVAVFLLVDGYQRRIDPTIVGSSPTNGVMWSTNDPIRIAFNKEMDKQSVEDALGILPTSERDRLELSWEGNTLIIGENRTLRPGTSYSVTVTSEARDKWGNRLSEPFTVGFTTNQSVALESTPSPHPSATASPEVAVVSQASPTPAIASSPTTESSGPTPTRERTNEQTPTNTPEPVNSGQGSGQPPAQNDPPDQPDDDPPPTATATQPAAPAPTNTPEPEPEPTARPTEVPPTATAEPEPEPTSTPEPEPEPSPTEVRPTATPEPEPEPTPTEPGVAITGAFANVYARNEPVRIGLGEPIAPQLGVSVQELDFQLVLGPAHLDDIVHQALDHVHLVEDRELHR